MIEGIFLNEGVLEGLAYSSIPAVPVLCRPLTLLGQITPAGSKYPIFMDFGSKNHTIYGLWFQKPYYLWTLVRKTIPLMAFGSRVLKYWALVPLETGSREQLGASHDLGT